MRQKADVELIVNGGQSAVPISLKVIREVKTAYSCNTVCQYKGFTYAGLGGGAIDRIDSQGKITKAFIKVPMHVFGIRAHKDRFYILMHDDRYLSTIYVYALNGTRVNSWNHAEISSSYGNRMIMNNEDLVVGDWLGKQIIIYTLTGTIKCKVPLGDYITPQNDVAMAAVDKDSVAISDKKTSTVTLISLVDGTVIWKSTAVKFPLGIVLHDNSHLLISSEVDQSKFHVLDISNGR